MQKIGAMNAPRNEMKKTTYKNYIDTKRTGRTPKSEQNHPAFQLRTSSVLTTDELRGIVMELLG